MQQQQVIQGWKANNEQHFLFSTITPCRGIVGLEKKPIIFGSRSISQN